MDLQYRVILECLDKKIKAKRELGQIKSSIFYGAKKSQTSNRELLSAYRNLIRDKKKESHFDNQWIRNERKSYHLVLRKKN